MRLFGTEKLPKGPSFRSARLICKDLGCSSLEFKEPAPRPAFGGRWEEEPGSVDLNSPARFELAETWDKKVIECMRWQRLYSNNWRFNGFPIIQPRVGYLSCFVDVHAVDGLPINESLFDFGVLADQVLTNRELCIYARTEEGYTEAALDVNPDLWPDVLGPVNSQWLNKHGNDWLYIEEQQLTDTAYAINWISPITHQHYVCFRFVIRRHAIEGPNAYRIEERVRPDTFLDLMHQIMDSVKLELCEEMKAERDRIRTIEPSERRPVIEFTPEQLKVAKHVLYMSSFRKPEDGDDRWSSGMERLAPREEVEAFLDERVKFKPLPGSYPRGEIIYNRVPVLPISRLVDSLPQSSLKEKVDS